MITQATIEAALARHHVDYWLEGQCHTLAYTLYRANGNQGYLLACIRHQINDETNTIEQTWYSHMVYQDSQEQCWDVQGPNADERWHTLLDIDEDAIDKWGLRQHVEWVSVSPEQVHAWLAQYNASIQDHEIHSILGNVGIAVASTGCSID